MAWWVTAACDSGRPSSCDCNRLKHWPTFITITADYLAITTIAIAEVLRISFRSQRLLDLTGSFGLPSIEDRNAEVSFSEIVTIDWNPISDGSYGFGA